MSQPSWKFVANLGDINPILHGGKFVYVDETGVYPPELEILEHFDEDGPDKWTIYRFPLEPCTYVDGVLSDNPYHPGHPAWFVDDLDSIADSIGLDVESLIEGFVAADPVAKAWAWEALTGYYSMANFDAYPLEFACEDELRARYRGGEVA